MQNEWLVMRVKSNREKIAASFLNKKKIQCFLPVIQKPRIQSGRIANRVLFPGYLFVCPGEMDFPGLRYIPGTCGFVGLKGKPAVIKRKEIEAINAMVKSGLNVESHQDLQLGELIEITGGPLSGYRGELVRKKNGNRFVINISLLNQSISVEIEREWINSTRTF